MTTETPRRTQIEEVASALFRERGYAATSVRDIAQALNIQGPSLYAHVASKEDVLWSIVKRAADRFQREVMEAAAGADIGAARLRAMIRAHVAIVTSAQRESATFLHEWRFLSPGRRDDIAARRDRYESLFRDAITEGTRAGAFSEVDPRLAAMAILSSLNGIATWYRPDGARTPDQVADDYADLFLRGLAPEPHSITRTIT